MSKQSDECVEIKPSTEKIPDEYEIEKASVHIFMPKDSRYNTVVETFKKSMKNCSFEVPDENVHIIRSKKDLQYVYSNTQFTDAADKDDKTCLIVAFFGESDGKDIHLENGDVRNIKDITSPFVFAFRHKPKLFFIQGLRKLSNIPKMDSVDVKDTKFDPPLEADQFIIFNTVDPYEDINTFMNNITYNIEENGERDDVFDIVMFSETNKNKKRPMFLSTLRKKFYFKKSPYRGYEYEYIKAWEIVDDKLSNNAVDMIVDNCNSETSATSLNDIPAYSLSGIYNNDINMMDTNPNYNL
ncbi:PREDICTED: uncharacterized protein LOC108560081 [Nicrophorus vespilloides]|uniref:Uncharacterized protein LOC108560081 n=1 Tax=Nicrophorus vespilloides TaxID=110193 RepID=A0ABM1MEK9_NICVS|nr:PREDICTED: uncharacterized protein LOC108560081 [Nicrophorus vespilloides]